MENEEKYEGWENRETWLVNLHLENEASSYRYWREQAEQSRSSAAKTDQVHAKIWTEAQAALFTLADQMREQVTEAIAVESPSLVGDLIATALSRVEWREIAEHWLEKDAT
ncbi:DUF7249 family protein [Bythopirellula goksoeyrii]|uniref:Uncharacterized protein n=1 Tax=Bythopirellula goksoeyrii TaxID=1400387 RepID=A0A5B9QQC6_9BACT|nr:hypothetical protein [Bythopirellula goksoeyrii]QEG36163.1 hypothetical protein Pr1d_34720 [Bythopirellula goksoeyrii]